MRPSLVSPPLGDRNSDGAAGGATPQHGCWRTCALLMVRTTRDGRFPIRGAEIRSWIPTLGACMPPCALTTHKQPSQTNTSVITLIHKCFDNSSSFAYMISTDHRSAGRIRVTISKADTQYTHETSRSHSTSLSVGSCVARSCAAQEYMDVYAASVPQPTAMTAWLFLRRLISLNLSSRNYSQSNFIENSKFDLNDADPQHSRCFSAFL